MVKYITIPPFRGVTWNSVGQIIAITTLVDMPHPCDTLNYKHDLLLKGALLSQTLCPKINGDHDL